MRKKKEFPTDQPLPFLSMKQEPHFFFFWTKSRGHHTAICEQERRVTPRDTDNSTLLVSATSSVLLQTSDCYILNPAKEKAMKIKVLLDSGSQQTYVSEKVIKFLGLKPIDKHLVSIKTFGNQKKIEKECSEYNFVLKGIRNETLRMYLKGLNAPTICDKIKGHKIQFMRENYPHLNNLELADTGGGGDIDLLVGADFYWAIVEGNVNKGESDGPVALSSKLGWILSGGPCNGSINVNFVNAQFVSIESKQEDLENKLSNFWNLDTVGIKVNEQSAYEKFMKDIDFENGRYVVKLPFKENVEYS